MTADTKDPVRLGDGMTGHSIGDERHRQDKLLERIEAADRLNDDQRTRMTRTLAGLRESPAAWLATRYLQSVLTRGPAMFEAAPTQLPLGGEPTLECGCGELTPAEDREQVDGGWWLYARCRVCRADLAARDTGGRQAGGDGLH